MELSADCHVGEDRALPDGDGADARLDVTQGLTARACLADHGGHRLPGRKPSRMISVAQTTAAEAAVAAIVRRDSISVHLVAEALLGFVQPGRTAEQLLDEMSAFMLIE